MNIKHTATSAIELGYLLQIIKIVFFFEPRKVLFPYRTEIRVSLKSYNKYQIKESKIELLIKPITPNVDYEVNFGQNI